MEVWNYCYLYYCLRVGRAHCLNCSVAAWNNKEGVWQQETDQQFKRNLDINGFQIGIPRPGLLQPRATGARPLNLDVVAAIRTSEEKSLFGIYLSMHVKKLIPTFAGGADLEHFWKLLENMHPYGSIERRFPPTQPQNTNANAAPKHNRTWRRHQWLRRRNVPKSLLPRRHCSVCS